ncbi:ankyrin repeat-containing NPR4-like [Olea europaea subsp. europaea]|uniref:Ankyrin repeat-containing NPR4-like n=1 Tax=Olea europaea subsp. europaea TaxID=158383 RepID=A0A8S0TII5_OLEEU|nr:ankyrin repeat-containing NPR4-like [Olea europaea subsp. europaea]
MRGREKLKTYKSKPRLGRDDESELSREVSYPPMDTHKNRNNPLVTETQVQQLQNMNNQTVIEIDSHVSNSNNAQHPIVHQETATEEVVTLCRAALRGDWKPIETALSSGKIIASTKITERGYTILHIAATAKQTSLVHKLVKNFDKSDLELLNNERNTAFCFATVLGVIEIVKVIFQKDILTSTEIQASELANRLWEQITKLPYSDRVKLVKKTKIFHDAAKIGNVEFLTLLTHSYPDLIWKVNKKKHSIFHVAVINRQEKVFRLIYQTGADKDLITFLTDDNENNILHLTGKMAPPSRLNIVSRAALQMQRELLRQDGEKWMKDTSSSCMVMATLIATIAFAAAFTVLGGNNEIGTPVFFKNKWFTVFVISDAVAMFSSATSIMMFLSILTSRYTEDDFLFSLPAKLMVGLISLFASIVYVVLTFSATFFLVYNEEKHGPLPRLVVALAWLPITIYAVLNHRLGIALIHSTCWPAVLMFRRGKHRLY